jgi:predicted nucleic acid-binding protein
VKKIADSGFIIAALGARDQAHAWARDLLERESPPWLVCEAVVAEIAAILGTPLPVLEMLEAGDLELAFNLDAERSSVLRLARKYEDQGMDLADACVVQMSELIKGAVVYTVDKKDFTVYRRQGNRAISCVFPE